MCYTFKSLLNISTNGALQNNNLLMKKKNNKAIDWILVFVLVWFLEKTNKQKSLEMI